MIKKVLVHLKDKEYNYIQDLWKEVELFKGKLSNKQQEEAETHLHSSEAGNQSGRNP